MEETAEKYGFTRYGNSYCRVQSGGKSEIILSQDGTFSIYIDVFARTFEVKKGLKPAEIKQLMKILGSK